MSGRSGSAAISLGLAAELVLAAAIEDDLVCGVQRHARFSTSAGRHARSQTIRACRRSPQNKPLPNPSLTGIQLDEHRGCLERPEVGGNLAMPAIGVSGFASADLRWPVRGCRLVGRSRLRAGSGSTDGVRRRARRTWEDRRYPEDRFTSFVGLFDADGAVRALGTSSSHRLEAAAGGATKEFGRAVLFWARLRAGAGFPASCRGRSSLGFVLLLLYLATGCRPPRRRDHSARQRITGIGGSGIGGR